MKKAFQKILYFLSLAWIDDAIKEAVDAGICDFSGQGRDKYGK